MTKLVTQQTSNKLVTQQTSNILKTFSGLPGPPGPPGPAGGVVESFVAGDGLSALRVVYANEDNEVLYADKDDLDTMKNIVGVTTQAAVINDDINVRTLGVMEDNSWNWNMLSDTSLFLGDDGVIQQGPPVGNVVRIGFAISPTSIFVRLGEIISI